MPFISAGSIASVLSNVYKVAADIHERVETLSANDDFRQRIQKVIKELRQAADQLKASEIEELPETCRQSIEKIECSLGSCRQIIEGIESKGTLTKLIKVHAHKQQLEILERELDNTRGNLHFVLTTVIIAQNSSLKRCVVSTTTRVESTVVHPTVGVYKGSEASNKHTRPCCIAKPKINVRGDLMIIQWVDFENTTNALRRYEVRYDDQNEMIVPGDPHEMMVKQERTPTFQLKLGPPKILPGKVYTVQVRAVNSEGPGEWSPQNIFRFKIGRPEKPSKPRLSVTSPSEVLLISSRLTEKEEHGSRVSHCVVEYLAVADTSNVSEWQRRLCPLKSRNCSDKKDLKFSINELIPDTTYTFRVRMVNEAGESQPSDSADIVTTQLIPGQPQELRISSKRTGRSIKIRWKPPADNAHAVHKYQAQYQLVKTKTVEEWHDFAKTDASKLSATVTSLDTDTEYRFQVRAVNNKDQYGSFSESVVGETRYGKFGKALASAGAFVGGTVGGPLMGAVSIGYVAGSAAEDIPDSKVGKKAAATAAGIGGGIGGALLGTIGAPLFGGVAAVMAYKGLGGATSELSPQSSEDEDESMFRQIYSMSKKKSDAMVNKKK